MLHVGFVIPLVAMGWCALVGGVVVLVGNLAQLLREDEREYFHYGGYRNAFIVQTLCWTAAGAVFMALVAFIVYSIIAAG